MCIFRWMVNRSSKHRGPLFCFIIPRANHSSPRKLKPKLSSSRGSNTILRFHEESRVENIFISRCNELQHRHSFICTSVLILYTLKPHSTLNRSMSITELLCKIWGFNGGNYDECGLLRCDAAWLLEEPKFWTNVSPPSLELQRIREPGIALAVTSNGSTQRATVARCCESYS
jgi:hypothetical protein